MKITFKTHADRMQHPQAKLIPELLWRHEELFHGELDLSICFLMEVNNEELNESINKVKGNFINEKEKKTAWLAIAFSHPEATFSMLYQIACLLEFSSNSSILNIFIRLGNLSHLTAYFNHLGEEIVQELIQNNWKNYLPIAAQYRHFELFKLLESKVKFTEYEIYKFSYVDAAVYNFRELLEHLDSFKLDFISTLETRKNAYLWAAQRGHINILKYLEEKSPNHIQDLIAMNWCGLHFGPYNWAALFGNLEVLKHLESRSDADAMRMSNDYGPYRSAARNGQLRILKYLPKNKEAYFSAYKDAAKNDHFEVLEFLELQFPNLIQEMILENDEFIDCDTERNLTTMYFESKISPIYREAATKGHLHRLKHLESKMPTFLVKFIIESRSFWTFDSAAKGNHTEVCHHLLNQSSACFAYAESHVQEYNHITQPFLEAKLNSLHQQSEAYLLQHPNGVFDIEEEQALLGFYLLRSLIRRNDRAKEDELRFLLSIPSVKALAHQEVTKKTPNELLRLALSTGNEVAARLLLNIEAVRTEARQHNFYQQEQMNGLDLNRLAQDRESSMTALTQGESKRLEAAISRYQPEIEKRGIEVLMTELRSKLIALYEAHPACINIDNKSIVLPVHHAEFVVLASALNVVQKKKALEEYYKHTAHTAWRYLSKPNHWMHRNASYVYTNEERTEFWSTFEEYQPLIAMMYLAASDEEMPPTKGHTLESRVQHFVNELALIGRAHNWDKPKRKKENQPNVEEEYDDLEGDRPSCFSGVKRRLLQSVIGHPFFNLLTEEVFELELKTFAFNHFRSIVKEENKYKLKAFFDEIFQQIDEPEDEDLNYIKDFNIPSQKQQGFIQYLTQEYGPQFSADYESKVNEFLTLNPKAIKSRYRYHVLKPLCTLEFYLYLDKICPDQEKNLEALTNRKKELEESKRQRVMETLNSNFSPQFFNTTALPKTIESSDSISETEFELPTQAKNQRNGLSM